MSLVNDMLRDLDRRRQDSTRTGRGMEHLVPVVEASGGGGARSLLKFVLALVVTIMLIMGAGYVWQTLFVTPAPAFVPTVLVPAANAPLTETAPQVAAEQFAAISQRLEELEAENRSLLEAQDALSRAAQLSAAEAEDAATSALALASASENAVAALAPVVETPVVETPVPVSEVGAATPSAASAAGNDTVSLIRSPRTPSFAERDQLQVQDAMRLAAANQSEQAVRQLRAFLDGNPSAHESREMLVKLALQMNELGAAQAVLSEGIALDGSRIGFRKLQARILLGQGAANEAAMLLSVRAPSIEADIEYHDILATAYLSAQDFENAARSYEALVQRSRDEARWWYGLATAWDNLGKTRDAALAYEQATKLPSLSAALRQRSQQRIAEIGL